MRIELIGQSVDLQNCWSRQQFPDAHSQCYFEQQVYSDVPPGFRTTKCPPKSDQIESGVLISLRRSTEAPQACANDN